MNKPISNDPWVSNIEFEKSVNNPSKLELDVTVRVVQFGVFLTFK